MCQDITTRILKTTAVTIAALVFTLKPVMAIENLQVRVQGTDAILTWPSVDGETFIVRYRSRLDEAHPWTILASSYPAAAGTSQTSFTHSGIVEYPPGNGGGGGNPEPPAMTSTTTELSTTGKAKKPKNSPLLDMPPVP